MKTVGAFNLFGYRVQWWRTDVPTRIGTYTEGTPIVMRIVSLRWVEIRYWRIRSTT